MEPEDLAHSNPGRRRCQVGPRRCWKTNRRPPDQLRAPSDVHRPSGPRPRERLVQVHAINADQQVLGHVRSLEEWITGQQGLGAPDSLSDNFFRLDRILFQSWNAPARGRGDHYIDGSHRFRAPSRAGQQ